MWFSSALEFNITDFICCSSHVYCIPDRIRTLTTFRGRLISLL